MWVKLKFKNGPVYKLLIDNKPDIFALIETKMTSSKKIPRFEGYSHIYVKLNTESGTSGGFLIYLKKDLMYRTVQLVKDHVNGIVCLKIISEDPSKYKNLVVAFVYCRTANYKNKVESSMMY